MKRLKIILLLLSSLFLTQCTLFEPSYSERYFVFKNFTDTTYENTTISVVEIRGEKATIRYSENVRTIYSRTDYTTEDTTSDYPFIETKTKSTEAYDEAFLDFLDNNDSQGAFMISLSDDLKLFIRVTASHDIGFSLDSPRSFQIDITDNGLETFDMLTEINGVLVQDLEIVE